MSNGGLFFYKKAIPRKENVVAAVNMAGVLKFNDKESSTVCDARIAVGAVAPTPLRLHTLEDALKREGLTSDTVERLAALASGEIRPITDIRGSADYRRALTRALLYESLLEVCERRKSRVKQ